MGRDLSETVIRRARENAFDAIAQLWMASWSSTGLTSGKALLAFARSLMPDEMWLRTVVANRRAVAWYEGEGFIKEREEGRPEWNGPRASYRWRAKKGGTTMTIRERLEAIHADITTLNVDAIVNAANTGLLPGGGVDGAIRRAAGPGITEETRTIGGCPTGSAVITGGYDLPARHVIHTAAPIWEGGTRDDEQDSQLAGCYASVLKLADDHGIKTIAFPAIGTGIYGWPAERAAEIAFNTVVGHLAAGGKQTRVIFCCFNEADRARYQKLIDALTD